MSTSDKSWGSFNFYLSRTNDSISSMKTIGLSLSLTRIKFANCIREDNLFSGFPEY